ncbi:hypothetical protein GCM10020367_16600 [Streptomyces sannanensis]|uniref:DedA family protein n=1 Tax=Streptomyces sannanensis TaxID=285536 RepID=A0ABP6S8C2_9ACTN
MAAGAAFPPPASFFVADPTADEFLALAVLFLPATSSAAAVAVGLPGAVFFTAVFFATMPRPLHIL